MKRQIPRANLDTRQLLKENGIAEWEIAAKEGISESLFLKRLRFEFSPEEKARIRQIVDELKEG
jgi:hypothetical protein